VLRFVGLGSVARPWLGDFSWALAAVGLIGAWITTGLCMVLFLSGVQKIPRDLYDAARVDGAGPFREFLAVTLPGLRNELAVAATLTIIGALRSFDVIFVTTSGGPGDATTVPGILIYRRAFTTGQVGSACALAATLALIIFAITFLITRIADRSDT
jgi:raffinose/stachyose/melibiose transport system permease protein